jgi:MFS family permease
VYNRNLVFAAACLGMLLFGIVFLSLGSVNNLLAERFHLDDNGIGTLTALLPFGILAGSLIFGPIVDRFGYRWLLIVCALLVFGGLEGMAFGNSQKLIQLFVFLIGFGGGVLNGATNALAADVSEGERAAKLSLLGVFFGIGALGMPFTLAALAKSVSLPAIVAGIGGFILIPVAWFLWISFPPPKQQPQTASLMQSLALAREPLLLLAGLALAVQSGMEGMSNDWTTRYFKKVTLAGAHGVEVEQKCLYALSGLVGAMVVTRICLGFLLKRIPSAPVLFASIVFTLAGALVVMSQGSYAIAVFGMVLIGIGLSACFPVVLACVGDRFPEKSGTVFSIVFVAALLGNMAINKSLGFIASRFGIAQYAKVMLVCLLASAVLLALVLRQISKSKAGAASMPIPQPNTPAIQ